MEQFLEQFLIPILSVSTLIFILFSFFAKRHIREHEERESKRHIETKKSLNSMDNYVRNIYTKIDKSLIPEITKISKKVTSEGPNFSAISVQKALEEGGYGQANFIDQDETILAVTIIIEDLDFAIAHLITTETEKGEILIESYAFDTEKRNDIYEALLKMNNDYAISGIGIHETKNRNLIIPQHILLNQNTSFDPKLLLNCVEVIEGIQVKVYEYLEEINASYKKIDLDEYFKFIAEE